MPLEEAINSTIRRLDFGKSYVYMRKGDYISHLGFSLSSEEETQKTYVGYLPELDLSSIIEKNNVFVFSTNYALYGDMSQRVMNILAELIPGIEVYSIDEAFLDVSHIPQCELIEFGIRLKDTINKWTGIPLEMKHQYTYIIDVVRAASMCAMAQYFWHNMCHGTVISPISSIRPYRKFSLYYSKIKSLWRFLNPWHNLCSTYHVT